MRGRQRHLNPTAAGAVRCYDARYLTYADGTPMGQTTTPWTDRTGNANATQTSSTQRPTFETNEINGQPAVLFDGSNDALNFTAINLSNAALTLSVHNRATSGIVTATFGDNARFDYQWSANNTRGGRWVGTEPTALAADTSSGQMVISIDKAAGAGIDIRINGGTAATQTQGTSDSNIQFLGFGKAFNNGLLSYAVYINSAVGEALRKRLQYHAGYSFKIATS